jgi:anti-sigma regulatory factor (Ser/Thr protein kinase)
VRTGPGAIDLTIEDDGAPFDPLAAPPPPAGGSLEEVQLGGLGIPMIRKLAARLAYEPMDRAEDGALFQPVNRLRVSIVTDEG